MKVFVPNTLTLISIGCGFTSLISLIEGRYIAGMVWMFLAIIFDAIDGKAASVLNARSDIGSALDSLSDVVSFAVLPGVSIYLIYQLAPQTNTLTQLAAWIGGVSYTCAGVLREARFLSSQLDRTRGEGFLGLPIAPPAGLNVALFALFGLFPDEFYHAASLVIIFLVVVLNIYLMTMSNLNYRRWDGRSIALQTGISLAIGILGYLTLGTIGAFLAFFYVAICVVYIVTHPLIAIYRGITSPV